ncbi:hypothetical protein H0O02_01915 [Candidatus Micrarchaeota archaeon]|nr:hypothetical protein [Candidatus Micrarchaeota archaeon]
MQQFLDIPEAEWGKVRIIIDHRESGRFDEYLTGMGAAVKRQALALGDFLCSAKLAVERKTRADFESSIIDGRLFSQLQELAANYPNVVLLVEGTRDEAPERVGKEAVLGAYAAVLSDFGASLIFTKDMKSTAEIIFALAKHEQLAKKHPMRVFAKRKTLTPSQSQRAVIETLPMVGPKMARKLLLHFGSVEKIASAAEKELEAVPGLGKKRAKVIRSLLVYGYDEEEDEMRGY